MFCSQEGHPRHFIMFYLPESTFAVFFLKHWATMGRKSPPFSPFLLSLLSETSAPHCPAVITNTSEPTRDLFNSPLDSTDCRVQLISQRWFMAHLRIGISLFLTLSPAVLLP